MLYRVKNVETIEELRDVYQHFLLYYGHEIPAMRNAEKKQKAQERAEQAPDEEQPAEEDQQYNLIKQATRRSGYSICLNAKLGQCQESFLPSPPPPFLLLFWEERGEIFNI